MYISPCKSIFSHNSSETGTHLLYYRRLAVNSLKSPPGLATEL